MSSQITINPKMLVFKALGGFTENETAPMHYNKGKVAKDADKILEELYLYMRMNSVILDVDIAMKKVVFVKC
jgi:hypothetical protein